MYTTVHLFYKEEEYLFIEEIIFGKHNLTRKDNEITLNINDKKLLIIILLIIKNNSAHLQNPRFTMCDCGHKPDHGHLYSQNGFESMPIISKSEGFSIVQDLLESNMITDGEAAQLNTLIDLSKLLTDPSCN